MEQWFINIIPIWLDSKLNLQKQDNPCQEDPSQTAEQGTLPLNSDDGPIISNQISMQGTLPLNSDDGPIISNQISITTAAFYTGLYNFRIP